VEPAHFQPSAANAADSETADEESSNSAGKVAAVALRVGDVLDEQHEQEVVLAAIHAAAEFIAGRPEG
jgi:hypothetical protein